VVTCKCKKVCYNPCYQNPCYNPYNQVNWTKCPPSGCTTSWCGKNPGACSW
jgi:hypothetical protein